MFEIILPEDKCEMFHEIAIPLSKILNANIQIKPNFEFDFSNERCVYVLIGYETQSHCPAKKYIVCQFEPVCARLGKEYWNALYVYQSLMKDALCVLEYSYQNIHVMKHVFHLPNVVYTSFGYHEHFDKFINKPITKKDNDVIFLGNPVRRRLSILNNLKSGLTDLKIYTQTYDDEKYSILNNSKILINIHMDSEKSCLEMVRIVYAIANGCLVVSEPSGDKYTDAILKEHVVFCEVSDMTRCIKELLRTPHEIHKRAQEAYKWLKTKYTYSKLLQSSDLVSYVPDFKVHQRHE